MASCDQDRVRRHFDACSSSLFSTDENETVSEVFAPFSSHPQVSEICFGLLSPQERYRADRFANGDDRDNFIQRRAFRRYFVSRFTNPARDLSLINFSSARNGRPVLNEFPKTWFSFASTQSGFIAAQSTRHAVGVDLEDWKTVPENLELARQFFTAEEADLVTQLPEPDRSRQVLRLWCLKEAALKSIGEGLPFGMQRFALKSDTGNGFYKVPDGFGMLENYFSEQADHPTFCAAMVLRTI
ncbi:MAG: 4'-phosphopantetheinyl transferase family protein [Rhizobiaceae bacterium]